VTPITMDSVYLWTSIITISSNICIHNIFGYNNNVNSAKLRTININNTNEASKVTIFKY